MRCHKVIVVITCRAHCLHDRKKSFKSSYFSFRQAYEASFKPKVVSSVSNYRFSMTSFPVNLFPAQRSIVQFNEHRGYIYINIYIYMHYILYIDIIYTYYT